MTKPGVAVFGAGRWGKNHVRNFYELGALRAVVDPSPSAAETVRAISPDIRLYATADEVLKDPAIAGVVLATPAPNHKADTLRALEAGKHVLVEKPMALSVADAQAMTRRADELGKVLMVGHLLLYSEPVQYIAEQIRSGYIGDVWHIDCHRNNFGTVRSQEDVFWSFSPHDVAVVCHLLGNPEVATVQHVRHAHVQPAVADIAHSHYRFTGGATAHVTANWLWPDKDRGLTVIGTQGSIWYDEIAQKVSVYRQQVRADLSLQKESIAVKEFGTAQPLAAECQHFLDCMQSGARPISHGAHGVVVVQMMES